MHGGKRPGAGRPRNPNLQIKRKSIINLNEDQSKLFEKIKDKISGDDFFLCQKVSNSKTVMFLINFYMSHNK